MARRQPLDSQSRSPSYLASRKWQLLTALIEHVLKTFMAAFNGRLDSVSESDPASDRPEPLLFLIRDDLRVGAGLVIQ